MTHPQHPRRRVIAPVTSAPRRGPKMGRMGLAILLLVALAGFILLICGPPPRPRAAGAPSPAPAAGREAPERPR
jgi:hypothetical protein